MDNLCQEKITRFKNDNSITLTDFGYADYAIWFFILPKTFTLHFVFGF